MRYEFPRPRTGDVRADLERLWEDLWMLVERLNMNADEQKEMEEKNGAAET